MTALPKQLYYSNRVDSMGARPYTSSMQPQGAQNYGVSDVIIINIPTNRNTVMSSHDSYLKMSMVATNNANVKTWARLSKAGAHGFIQRLRLKK